MWCDQQKHARDAARAHKDEMKHEKKEAKLHNKAVKAAMHGHLFKAAKLEVRSNMEHSQAQNAHRREERAAGALHHSPNHSPHLSTHYVHPTSHHNAHHQSHHHGGHHHHHQQHHPWQTSPGLDAHTPSSAWQPAPAYPGYTTAAPPYTAYPTTYPAPYPGQPTPYPGHHVSQPAPYPYSQGSYAPDAPGLYIYHH